MWPTPPPVPTAVEPPFSPAQLSFEPAREGPGERGGASDCLAARGQVPLRHRGPLAQDAPLGGEPGVVVQLQQDVVGQGLPEASPR